jgi:hypothetical protein
MGLTDRSGAVVLRGGGYNFVGACAWAFFVLLSIAPIATGRPLGIIAGSVLMLVTGSVLVFWLRAEVVASNDHLFVRSVFRTTRLEWPSIDHARVVPTNGNQIFAIVRVTTADGRRIKADGVGNRWKGKDGDGPVYRMAAEINDRAAAARTHN